MSTDTTGLTWAGLGLYNDTIREVEPTVEMMPVFKNAISGLANLEILVMVYAFIEEKDLAIDQLEHLLSTPLDISVSFLKISLYYDCLCDRPRFLTCWRSYMKEHGN